MSTTKSGCRSSELANIKLSEIHLDHPDVLEYYLEMGSHEMLNGVNREHVKCMRADVTDTSVGRAHDALNHYVHTYYEDIEQLYEKMYQRYI